MAQNKTDRKFIDGIFMKKSWEGESGILISTGIKKREFIDALEAIEEDERGFINVTIGTRKDDPQKFSMFKDDWKPGLVKPTYKPSTAKTTPAAKPATGKSTPAKPVKAAVTQEEDDGDDLPF